MARPVKEINWDIVEKMIEAGSPAKEIYGKFRIDDKTFYRRFKREYGVSFGDYGGNITSCGLGDIRLNLHLKSLNNKAPGNATLLMFLGRTRLGLREPDATPLTAANQPQIDQSHRIMELEHKIAELEANANKPQAE